jgi:uncharacterized membrane protein YkvA (DUF1232 family)
MSAFSKLLQGELAKRGWSYSDLAARSGLHVSLISRVARGLRKPTATFVQRCAAAFGLPLPELMIAAGLLDEALSHSGAPEAAALGPYIQYAATPEGEEEILTRLPTKMDRVKQQSDRGGKIAVLLEWVATLRDQFLCSSGAIKAVIGGALLYFLSPVDLVPDFIPTAGLVDDLSVVTLVMGLVASSGSRSES